MDFYGASPGYRCRGALRRLDATRKWPAFLVGALVLLPGAGGAPAPAERAEGEAAQERCFGAAARAPGRPCRNPRLRLTVRPRPAAARVAPNAPCRPVGELGGKRVCEFGVRAADATGTIALVGDSHAGHWRPALELVAQARGWRGISLGHASCPLQKALRDLPEPSRTSCARWKRRVLKWFGRHPEVTTVFVSGLTGGSGVVASRGRSQFETAADGYREAWRALPSTVQTIVVLRDSPKVRGDTDECVERALARRRSPGAACAVPRREAVDPDPAVVAAEREGSPRVRVIDMTRYFCGPRSCPPVIGGALTHKDSTHLTGVFVTTLGPYLLREVERLLPAPAARASHHAAAARTPCFGAPSRDPEARCTNPALRTVVAPTPAEARTLPNPCPRIERHDGLSVCAFGVPRRAADEVFALVGDSHAGHLRQAFDGVARTKRWHGLSLTHTSCPLQKAVRDLPEPRRTHCARWKRHVFAWFERHPEVRTVYVTGLTGGSGVVAAPGQDEFDARVAGYVKAWRALPGSVERIVVVRDTPKQLSSTPACIRRALAHARDAGRDCAVPRRLALDPDAAVAAAARVGSDRVRAIDLTDVFCDRRRCFPVIGGALVRRDQNHLTATFSATLAGPLRREIERVR